MNKTTLLRCKNSLRWWTFAGKITNLHIAAIINTKLGKAVHADNLSIRTDVSALIEAQRTLSRIGPDGLNDEDIIPALLKTILHYKFHECLTLNAMQLMAQKRFYIIDHVKDVLRMPINIVDESGFDNDSQKKL